MNPDLADIANIPFEYEINGTKLKLVQLSIGRLFAMTEKKVRDQHIADARELCKGLPDSEKSNFMQGALKTIPTGKELATAVETQMQSLTGIVDVLFESAVTAGSDIEREQMVNLITPDNMQEMSTLVSKVCGVSIDSNEGEQQDPN